MRNFPRIVLSAHFDIAKPVPFIKFFDNKLTGLIDNFAGVFVAYETAKKTGVPLYLTNFEETCLPAGRAGMNGAREVARKLSKNTLVIVVDTTRDAGVAPAYIGNVYNFTLPKKLPKDIFIMPGYFEKTEDETWVYGHEFGFPCFYFGIPIQRGYHNTNNSINVSVLHKSSNMLMKLIALLQE